MHRIIHTFKKILQLLFNRIFYVAVALMLQLAWLMITVWRLAAYSKYISNAIAIISVLVVLWIVNKKINPSYKLGWTILILVSPVFGVMLYLLFGKSRIAQAIQNKYAQVQKESIPFMESKKETIRHLEADSLSAAVQSNYILRYSSFPVHENTTAEYFQVGDDMFPVLVRELEQAQHYIYIEYFIINDGVMWRTILDILEHKASEGVDVRLIYDGFGCLTTLPYHYDRFLKEKGIQCRIFNPFRPLLNIVQNNRDHRKICVIDGHTGFTGGINLADEYINQKERFGHWKDTAVMLKGEAVWNMTVMFLHMWNVINNSSEPIDHEIHMPHRFHQDPFAGNGFVQPYSDTPLDGEIVGENVYLNIINRARKYVYICTPYLIIDNEMMTALCLAAKSGVDVRIITPSHPDKWYVHMVSRSYYQTLIESGVKIYEYQPGFIHAKMCLCDDDAAMVGTANLDYRSLYLHYENAVLLYHTPVTADIKKDIEETLEKSRLITIEELRSKLRGTSLLCALLKLLAPLM